MKDIKTLSKLAYGNMGEEYNLKTFHLNAITETLTKIGRELEAIEKEKNTTLRIENIYFNVHGSSDWGSHPASHKVYVKVDYIDEKEQEERQKQIKFSDIKGLFMEYEQLRERVKLLEEKKEGLEKFLKDSPIDNNYNIPGDLSYEIQREAELKLSRLESDLIEAQKKLREFEEN